MNNKKRSLFVPILCTAFILGNCTALGTPLPTPTQTPLPETPTADAPLALPTAELGLAENPLIIALAPASASAQQINAARELAADFTARTGYVVLTIAPDSYTTLIDAFETGNAHMALLDPVSYELAYQKDLVNAQYALMRDGQYQYGAQFLAARKDGYQSYFNADAGVNTADANVALAQFNDRKPCWAEEASPSGYMVPLGLLNQAQVQTRPAAFVGSQNTVVRSLYVGGICDFGATYIDARKFPSLEDSMPDLVEQVVVIWQTPQIIPYEVLVFSTKMPAPMQALFRDLIPAILQTDAGNTAFTTTFGTDELQFVNDGDFRDFHIFMRASGLDLQMFIK